MKTFLKSLERLEKPFYGLAEPWLATPAVAPVAVVTAESFATMSKLQKFLEAICPVFSVYQVEGPDTSILSAALGNVDSHFPFGQIGYPAERVFVAGTVIARLMICLSTLYHSRAVHPMPVIGTQQSPIKIDTAKAIYTPLSSSFLTFNYSRPLAGKIDTANHNFVFDPPGDENHAEEWSITVGGTTWLIRQIHMHAAAEHLVDSETPKPFEVHLVHSLPGDKTASREKLVVGVFIKAGKETREKKSLEKFADQIAKRARDSSGPEPTEVHPYDFLPDSALESFFRYEGSLTGTPFTEDVSWFVMKDDGVIEQQKFDALHKHAEHEARAVQFLNRRFVLKTFA